MLAEIIYPALVRLARAFPSGFGSRPNSFAAIYSFGEIAIDNLAQTQREGGIGQYWGRRWEASGKDPSLIQYENSLLFLRKESIEFPLKSKVCHRVEIGIASLPDCEGCANSRSDIEIEIDNAKVLEAVVRQVSEIKPYNVNVPPNLGGVGLSTYWLMPAEVSWLKSNSVNFPNLGRCDAYLSVSRDGSELRSFNYGKDGMIVTAAKLEVCWCDSTVPEFSFAQTEFSQAAFTGCESC